MIDTLAVRRGNICYIKNSIASGASDMTVAYGKSTDEILVGDWDGDGYDTLCARRGNTCYFQKTIQATVHDRMVRYGKATDELYAGTWN
ncbi:MAG: hypothetical protein LUG27_03140 [Clostridiales bacterium]|nr:hypothetical protein [Clostridiales bacterium]